MEEAQIRIMEGLPDDAFLLEIKNMINEINTRKTKIEHLEKLVAKNKKYFELTNKVQKCIRANPSRVEPTFKFETDADWIEANNELMAHQHKNELEKIQNEIDSHLQAIELTQGEINLQEEALVVFDKEKEKRGLD